MRKAFFYDTSLGRIGICEEEGNLTNIFFGKTVMPDAYAEEETEVLREAAVQIRAYAAGERKTFTLPLCPKGTAFELKVWQALQTIPYGETASYADIAAQVGNPKACRAVGRANGRNPLSIVVPCHRVIGKNGKLTGYAGGLPMKEKLLALERE